MLYPLTIFFYRVNSHGVNKTRTFTAQLTATSLKAQHYVKKVCTTPNIPPSTSQVGSQRMFLKILVLPTAMSYLCWQKLRETMRQTDGGGHWGVPKTAIP